MMRVNIRELIRFYDEDRQARRHANAIKNLAGEELNLATLVHYLQGKGVPVDVVDKSCTTGARRGVWLDAWLRSSAGAELFYYQVEVKSWSFHGAGGGRPLSVDCPSDEASRHRIATWARYWDAGSAMFRSDKVRKILTLMQCPTPAAPVRALLCLWDPLHPEGFPEPFFDVKPSSGDFDTVSVFSTSNYMRWLLQTRSHVDLPLHATRTRLNYLSSLFSQAETVAAQQGAVPVEARPGDRTIAEAPGDHGKLPTRGGGLRR